MHEPNWSEQRVGSITPRSHMLAAIMLAIAADIFQIVVYPLFVEGAASPAEDLLDLGLAGMFSLLLGWHWEFLPSFLGKLIPGVDLVPLWTLAVANVYRRSVYRKSGKPVVTIEGKR